MPGLGLGLGTALHRYKQGIDVRNILQKLDFSMDADKLLLLDVSGNNNHAKLVNSNCYNPSGQASNLSIISATPCADGDTLVNFSAEFSIVPATYNGFRVIIGRTNGNGFANFLSTILLESPASGTTTSKLSYYTANGVTYTQKTISILTVGSEYICKVSVNGTTGKLNAVINGTPIAEQSFTSLTPATDQAGEKFAICQGNSSYGMNGKIGNIRYYRTTNYTTCIHNWPCSEGNGLTIYDVVGTAHINLTTAYWGLYNLFHYNFINGFELYGDSSTSSKLIRVPIPLSGTKLTPTISGYTKFADCPAGSFNNFAETGIQRNYNDVAGLTSAGVAQANIIYHSYVDGNDGYSFCKNFGGEETEYTVFSVLKNRKSFYNVPAYAAYLRTGSIRRIIGTTGKVHNTHIKNACALNGITTTTTVFYDHIILNGDYALNATSLVPIIVKRYCGVVGQTKTGTILRGHLPGDTPKATINASSTFDPGSIQNLYIANLTAYAQNQKYVLHWDGATYTDDQLSIKNVKFEHLGCHEAYLIDPTITKYYDAIGIGWTSGSVIQVDDSDLTGIVEDGSVGRGFAAHANGAEAVPCEITINRTSLKSTNGIHSVRWAPYGTTNQLDKITFNDCTFDLPIYTDPAGVYGALADKMQLYIKDGNTQPSILYPSFSLGLFVSLQFEANNNAETIAAVAGTTTTLLMGNVITDTSSAKYHIRGDKNITDLSSLTGHVHLGADMLGNCTSVNKTMQLTVNDTTYTLTFADDYSAMTNAQVVTAINALLTGVSCPATCKLYDYLVNAKWRTI